ncbi:MAG: protein tyrosine phosphatase family protein [Snowella sp.]|nr:protein tyrosine phosphatase family protein [Snowella sp.]
MENIKQINDELAVIMTQVTPEQVHQLSQAGFKSILNLRLPSEEGFLTTEQEQAKNEGLEYVNIPVKSDSMNDELADQVIHTIDQLPKPLLIHCKTGMRSGAMALMYVATQQQMTAEEALAMGKQNGFDCDAYPQMKQFFEHYVTENTQIF